MAWIASPEVRSLMLLRCRRVVEGAVVGCCCRLGAARNSAQPGIRTDYVEQILDQPHAGLELIFASRY